MDRTVEPRYPRVVLASVCIPWSEHGQILEDVFREQVALHLKAGVKHIYVNHIINPTPEGASGQVNMLMIGLGGDKNKIEHDGHYEDTYVKTPQGWRFKKRVVWRDDDDISPFKPRPRSQ